MYKTTEPLFHHFRENPLSLGLVGVTTLHHFPGFKSTPVSFNAHVPVQLVSIYMLTFTSVQTRDVQKGPRMAHPHPETCSEACLCQHARACTAVQPLTLRHQCSMITARSGDGRLNCCRRQRHKSPDRLILNTSTADL